MKARMKVVSPFVHLHHHAPAGFEDFIILHLKRINPPESAQKTRRVIRPLARERRNDNDAANKWRGE